MKKSSFYLAWRIHFMICLIFTYLLGCSNRAITLPPESEQILEKKPNLIEIVLCSGEKVIVRNAYIQGDYLFGILVRENPYSYGTIEEIYRVPLNKIKSIQEKNPQIEEFIGLTILSAMFIGGIVLMNAWVNQKVLERSNVDWDCY